MPVLSSALHCKKHAWALPAVDGLALKNDMVLLLTSKTALSQIEICRRSIASLFILRWFVIGRSIIARYLGR